MRDRTAARGAPLPAGSRYPLVGDRVVVWVRSPSTAPRGPHRGVLSRVDLHDWCDVLLDGGELLIGEYHIKELVPESVHDADRSGEGSGGE